MNWQPIETAPKDKDILLFCPRLGVVRGGWNACKCYRSPKPYWTNDKEYLFGVIRIRNDQPTHWMPLPDAPPGYFTKASNPDMFTKRKAAVAEQKRRLKARIQELKTVLEDLRK